MISVYFPVLLCVCIYLQSFFALTERVLLLQMTFFGGIVMNELVNMVVKHSLAYPRLCGGHVFAHSGSAMPSDHAQFMAFFAVYSVLFIYVR